jgi:hypothetical protein
MWAISQVNKRRRAFLWAGTDNVVSGKCKISWPVVCSPKCFAGLGILDLRVIGFALRLRWEWQKRLLGALPWMRLPFRPKKMVTAMFSMSASGPARVLSQRVN